jgi:hypothetical protein
LQKSVGTPTGITRHPYTSAMTKFRVLVLTLGTLTIHLVGINFSQAAPTTKALTCGYSSNSDLVLAYGVNSVTVTNPNGCNTFGTLASLRITQGSGSTWTYSKTIGGVTTSGAYGTFDGTFQTGSLGTEDSFTLNLTSATSNSVMFYNDSQGSFNVYFNSQVESINPNPVVIGRQVTVTGSNLTNVTNLTLQGPTYFGVTTSDRTATQLTFIMPETASGMMGPVTVTAGTYKLYLGGTNVWLTSLTAAAAPAVTAPGAPTIGVATGLSPTSASISFIAPASNGGATIETYTATSTPGSITGRVFQSASGSIIITGLTSSTAYTFRVTASNSAGTSSASSATVSITTPSTDAEVAASAKAALEAAVAKRETEKLAARADITNKIKSAKELTVESFSDADIPGITASNISLVQAEIIALPETSRADLNSILKIARKYEVVGTIASDRVTSIYSDCLIEIGLIAKENKFKATLTAAIKQLPITDRSSYVAIQRAVDAKMVELQARKARLASAIARNASRYSK